MASSLELVILFGSVGALLSFSYVTYRALDIRRALAVGLYRRQVLGIGLISVGFLLNILFGAPAIAFNLPQFLAGKFTPLVVAWQVSIVLGNVLIFFQIDASILVARRSDPLLRDTFLWRRLRYVLWSLLTVGLVVFGLKALGLQPAPGPPVSIISGLYGALVAFFGVLSQGLIINAVSGAIILPVAAIRSRDHALRRSLVWFAVAVALLFSSIAPANLLSDTFQIVSLVFVAFPVIAYLLYRSEKSLVPLNRLSLVELGSLLGKETSLRPDVSYGQLV